MRSIPKTASSSPRRNLPLSLVAAVAMVLGGQSASADTLIWQGGSTWNGTDLNFQSQTTPGTNVAWTNSPLNSAVFSGVGTVGTVTVNAPITVGNITFNAAGYTIAGTALTLSNTIIDGTANATISANLAGTTGLTITNTSTSGIILSGTNTYSGETKIGVGGATTLRIDTAGALGNSSLVTVAGGSSLQINTTDPVGAGKTLSVAGSGVSFLNAVYAPKNLNATWAGTVKLDAADVRVGADVNGTLTLNGVIQNGTANTLTTSAYGTGANTGAVIISGTQNSYTGPTNILRGVLKLGAINALPTGTTLNVDSGAAAEDSIFDLNGFNQTVGLVTHGGTTGTGGSFITNNGASAATITISPSGSNSGTYDGIIQDGISPLALTKAGSSTSTQTLSGANTYSGLTTVSAGTLVVGHANALGSASAGTVVQSGASLAIGNGITTNANESVTISGTGGNAGALTTVAGSANAATWQGSVILGDGNARVGARAGTTLNISGPILGSGSFQNLALSGESGTGVIIISAPAGSNKYTGATSIIRGTLKIGAHDALPTGTTLDVDSATAGVGEDSTFDLNGFNQTVGALTRSESASAGKSFITNTGTSAATFTVNQSTTTTYSGSIRDGGTPSSALALTKSGNGTLTLTGANTYAGATTVNGGTLQLGAASVTTGGAPFTGANGTLASTNFQLNGGSFVIDNKGASNNNNNRIADTASFSLNGGAFVYRGSDQAATNSSETIGSIILGRGLSTLSVERGGSNTADLTASNLTRTAGGGIALIKGASLGRLLFTNAPVLVGGGTGATDTKIVPYLLGSSTNGVPDTFVTYDATTGLRPLNPTTEFVNDSITAGANTRITAATPPSVSTNTAINSLILAAPNDTTFNIDSGKTLTNTSGAMLFVNTNRISGGTLDFGNTEAILSVNSGATGLLASPITGSGGLSFFGPGTLALASTQSTYNGNTTLHSGVVAVTATSSFAQGVLTSGPFGLSTVVFAGSQIRTQDGDSSTPVTIGNAVKFQADTTFTMNTGKVGSRFEFTGPVALEGTRTLTIANEKGVTFSGVISDAAGQGNGLTFDKSGTGNGSVLLSGNNTYTGPTTIKSGTVEVSGSIGGSSSVAVNNSGSLILSGGASNRIADTAPVTLGTSGATGTATFSIDNSATTALGNPFQETVGKLTLTSDAILDLGLGSSGTILHFADSSLNNPWTGTLKIYNWTGTIGLGGGTDQLFFGSSLGGLTSTQLSQIIFYSDAGTNYLGSAGMLSSGEMVPVPEPSTLLCGAALLGFLGWRERRKIGRALSRKS